MDGGVFHDTNVIFGVYTQGSKVYTVIAANAPIRRQGGVEIFYRELQLFKVEAHRHFLPNAIIFNMVLWGAVVVCVGMLTSATDSTTINSFVVVVAQLPRDGL